MKKPLPILAACLVAVLAAYVLYAMRTNGGNPAPVSPAEPAGVTRALSVGPMAAFVVQRERKPMPQFAFKDGEGKPRTLAEWKGRVVLLNLWATWCAPCRKEMPELAKLERKLGSDRFEVVALSLDRKGLAASSAFLKEAGAENLKLYVDDTSAALAALRAAGLPSTFLVDAQGREIGRLVGPAEWASPEARKLVETALAEPG
jgi:thiol-disulfide isomerase/thioredoxin